MTGRRHFHCILDEGALHRPIGGPAVMRAQMERIIEVADLPKVTFQLIPLDVGAHPALDSTFVILQFAEPTVNDVVYVEGVVGNIYLETAADLVRYRRSSPGCSPSHWTQKVRLPWFRGSQRPTRTARASRKIRNDSTTAWIGKIQIAA